MFRLLMRFAPRGVRPTEVAEALGFRPNTLSHHLNDLTAAGLIPVERRGRSLFYSVDLGVAEDLIGYLALDVGRGRPDLLAPVLPPAKDHAMPDTHFDVLFICSGNSARPIFAEALLRDLGRGRFQAFSAGTRPGTDINPLALKVLKGNRQDIAGLRSKHVSEFQRPGAPVMDFVFTVCDLAAAEECPPWPGQPISGHWGLPDPIRAQGTEAERGLAFAQTYAALRHRVSTFVALPFETLDRIALQAQVDRVARPRMPSPMSDRPRIALNGLGRIGKLALRDLVDSGAGGRSGSSTTPRPTPSNTPCFWSSTASTAAGRGRSAMSPARSPSRAGASA